MPPESGDLVETLWIRYDGEGAVRAAKRDLASLSDKADREMDKVGRSVDRSQGRFRQAFTRIGDWAKAALAGVVAGAAAAAGYALYRAAGQAKAFDDAMVGVSKTTGLTGQALDSLSEQLLEVSARLGIGQVELAGIAETAGQLGIQGADDIATFSETVARMARVSDLTAGEAAESMAQISNAFSLPIERVENLGSVLNELSNTSTATAGALTDALSRVGPAAAKLEIPVENVAALSATLIDAGLGSRRAGTMLRGTFNLLQTRASEMAQQVGLDVERFAELVQTDALGALRQYLSLVGELEDTQQTAALTNIFGQQNISAVQILGAQVEGLNGHLRTSGNAMREGTSLATEFATQLQSLSGQWDLLTAKMSAWVTRGAASALTATQGLLTGINRLTASAEENAAAIGRLQGAAETLGSDRAALQTYRRLTALREETGLSAEQTKRLQTAIDDLAERYPNYVKQTNAAGEAVSLYGDLLGTVIERQQQMNRMEIGSRLDAIADQFMGLRDLPFLSNVDVDLGILLPEQFGEQDLERLRKHRDALGAEVRRLEETLEGMDADASWVERLEVRRQLGLAREEFEKMAETVRDTEADVREATRAMAGAFGDLADPKVLRRIEDALRVEGWDRSQITPYLQALTGYYREMQDGAEEAGRGMQALTEQIEEELRRQARLMTDFKVTAEDLGLAADWMEDPEYTVPDEPLIFRPPEPGAGTGAGEGLSPEDLDALRDALQAYVEATRIAEAATEDWQTALTDLFDAEARILELNEAIAGLGEDYVPGGQREGEEKTLRTLLELEKERRDTALERVEAEEAFVERIQSAIQNVETVIPLRVEADLPTSADLETALRESTGGALSYLGDAEAAARAYSNTLTSLENQLATGGKSQEQFARESAEATEEYLERLRSLYEVLSELYEGALPAKLERAFRQLFEEAGDEVERTGAEVEDLHATLEDVARAGRAVLGLVDTFGDLSDETRRFAEGLLGAVDNMSRLVELKNDAESWANLFSGASAVGAIAPALGAASGIVQAMSGLFSGGPSAAERRQAERLEDLSDQLAENVRAVRENTKALFEAARIGANLTEQEVERAEEILVEVEQGETDLGPLVSELSDILGIDLTGIVDPVTEALEGIQEMSYPAEWARTQQLSQVTGLDLGDQLDDADIRQIVSGLLTGAFTAAQEAEIMQILGLEDVDLSALDDLADLPGDLSENLGGFGKSVDGAAEKMRHFTENGLAEGTEAFREFTSHILELDLTEAIEGADLGGAGIRETTREGDPYEGPEAGRSLRDLLDEAGGLDLAVEEERERLGEIQRAIAQAVAEGAFDFGALSSDEIDTLLGVMGDFSGAMTEATRATDAAQERLRFMASQGLVEGTEALRMFAGMLQEVDLGGAGIEGGPTMQALLEEVEGLDLSTEEDRERLTEIRKTIAQAVAEEAFRYGAMTEEEMEGLLDTFMAFEEGRFSAPATEEEGRYTSQVQIESTITEYQANRLLLAQDEQVYLQTQIVDVLRRSADLTADLLTELTGREYSIEWPEPVETLTAPEVEATLSSAAPPAPKAPEAPAAPEAPDASKPEVNIDAPNVEVTAPDVDLEVPEIEPPPAPDVSVNTSAPVVSPAIDVTAPDVTLEAPTVDVAAPSVDMSAPVPPAPDVAAPPAPNVDVETLTMPQVIVEAPVVDVTAPEVHLTAPPVPEAPDVSVPDVTAEFDMNAAAGLLNTLTGQVEALAASQHDVVAPVHEENVSITSIEETTRKLSQRQTTYENTFNIYESGDPDRTARQIEDVLERQHLHD